MNYIKEAIRKVLDGKDKLDQGWDSVGLKPASLGLSLEGVASSYSELSARQFPASKNAYLKLLRKSVDLTNKMTSYFSNDRKFASEIRRVADINGHTVKKDNQILSISDMSGPVLDIDYAGNIEFKSGKITPQIQNYLDLVVSKFNHHDAYIVFKKGENYSDSENADLLRMISKSMLNNDIKFERLHLIDPSLQYVLDEMTPTPIRVEEKNGKYLKSDKPYDEDFRSATSVLARSGMNLIKYSGGNLGYFKQYQAIFEQEHNLKVEFAEKGDVITFKSMKDDSSISFRTNSIKDGGSRLRNEYSEVLTIEEEKAKRKAELQKQKEEKEIKEYENLFSSTSGEHQYTKEGVKSRIIRRQEVLHV